MKPLPPACVAAGARSAACCVLAGLLLSLTGCATAPKVQSERDVMVDLARYRTFAVLPLEVSGTGVDPGTVLRLGRPAEEAARQALTAKGMTETNRERADCAVLVRGQSIPKVEVTRLGYTPMVYGRARVYYPATSSAVDVQTTNERRLVVEVYDNTTRRLAWAGWIEGSGSGKVRPEKVQEGVGLILAGFPPSK